MSALLLLSELNLWLRLCWSCSVGSSGRRYCWSGQHGRIGFSVIPSNTELQRFSISRKYLRTLIMICTCRKYLLKIFSFDQKTAWTDILSSYSGSGGGEKRQKIKGNGLEHYLCLKEVLISNSCSMPPSGRAWSLFLSRKVTCWVELCKALGMLACVQS